MIDVKQISALSRLLRQGFVADPEQRLQSILQGVAHPTTTGWVVSSVLLAQRAVLSSDNELVMALLGLQPEVRQSWLRILAARCKEAGQMPGEGLLLDLITQLRGAAQWVEEQLPHALLSPSMTNALERELLGVNAEHAAATPMLTRILAAGFALNDIQAQALPPLPAVDPGGMQAGQNWLAGRLLTLPGGDADRDHLLVGAGENAAEAEAMPWVLANPWAMLLTMVVYAQYAWEAEACGGLLLELPIGLSAYQPAEVTVLVMGAEGKETRCGTLAELLLRVVGHMGMCCFPYQPKKSELNALLTSLIGQLLERRVWRYRDGVSGSNGQYQIYPDFADECYRITGSKVFNRTGKHLWQAVRIQAEQWRSELRPSVAKGAF